jgi:hypothetical protein
MNALGVEDGRCFHPFTASCAALYTEIVPTLRAFSRSAMVSSDNGSSVFVAVTAAATINSDVDWTTIVDDDTSRLSEFLLRGFKYFVDASRIRKICFQRQISLLGQFRGGIPSGHGDLVTL